MMWFFVLFFSTILAASEPFYTIKEQAKSVHSEYQDYSIDTLEKIIAFADEIQSYEASHKVRSFQSKKIEGVFYKLVTPQAVLYIPPQLPRFLLGSGSHKKVYRSLFFIGGDIEVVAAAVADDTVVKEALMFQKLSSCWDLDPFRAFFTLSPDSHILVLKYYTMGSFFSMRKRGVPCTMKEKLTLFKESIIALMKLHERGFSHRDLHNGNIMVHRNKEGHLQVGLIDLARTLPLDARNSGKAQGAVSRNPPEVLLIPFQKVDPVASDIYALGCCFYSFLLHASYPGSLIYDIRKFPSMSQKEKNKLYEKVQERYSELLKTKKMSFFQKIILRMVHPEPKKRIALSEALLILENGS